MRPGDKLYYLDYEETGCSYTIMSSKQSSGGGGGLPAGNYYMVKIDSLKSLKTYPVSVRSVDRHDGKYFSTPEKAKEAYKRFKEHLKEIGVKEHFG